MEKSDTSTVISEQHWQAGAHSLNTKQKEKTKNKKQE